MPNNDKLEDAKLRVLTQNTAQDVNKYLRKLFQDESRFRKRWIWELLQNARDAAPSEGVKVSLVRDMTRLLFRHNGIPFTDEGITHLIYHGSAKYDPEQIGQFGTGFLTTHLISPTVIVSGCFDSGTRKFRFMLDRRGSNASELETAMDLSWKAFTASLSAIDITERGEFTTEYEYTVNGDSDEVVSAGIADLMDNAGYLLAFNTKIRSLHLQDLTRSVTIEKKSSHPLSGDADLFDIEECVGGMDPTFRYLVLIHADEISAAIELEKINADWTIVHREETPRIFKAFPFTGTRNFSFPIVVNSEKFEPRDEDRDTLMLKASRGVEHSNMHVLAEGCDLSVRLAVLAAEHRWHGAATLLKPDPLGEWDWVDPEWLRELFARHFITPLRAAKVMRTVELDLISPETSRIPIATDSVTSLNLWDLLFAMRDIHQHLPNRDEACVWAEILDSWSHFLATPVEQLPESITVQKLCEQISSWGTVAAIEKECKDDIDVYDWLNQLHELISATNSRALFSQFMLIPNQRGILKKINEVRRDAGIDETLKDISDDLGGQTRDRLLHKKMRLKELQELSLMTEDEVLATTIQKLREKAKLADTVFRSNTVRLFSWIVCHDQLSKLDGFPVLTRATTDDDPALLTLFSDPNKLDETTLAPVPCWPESIRAVADLFPKKQTLSDRYYEALVQNTYWSRVADQGYLRLNPLFKTRRRGIPFIPDEPLPEKEKNIKHRTKNLVDMWALAFFEKDETGLDAVRRSKIRAINMLVFLATYVLAIEPNMLSPVLAECECGEKHHFYPAAWLIPMLERRWVPLGDSKQDSATAEAIARLFENQQEQLRRLTADNGRRLLEALNISMADLSLRAVAKDEDTRIALIDSLTDIVNAANNDAEKVRFVAEEIKQSPHLLDEIREHRERRQKVQRNQTLGAEVERLLKAALESYGLHVVRTGIGSDYAVSAEYISDEDYVIEGAEVLIEIASERNSFLVEIKATTGSTARMTVTQASTAVKNKDRFILCIVQLDSPNATAETVRDRCRFVMNIGDQVEPVWNEYLRYQQTKGEACVRVGEVELIVGSSEVRFGVADGAWTLGLPLSDAVIRIVALSSQRSSAIGIS
jgi:hypothetical protein